MRYDLRFPFIVAALLVVGLMTVSTAALAPRVSSGIFTKQLLGVGLSLLPIGLMWWAGRDRLYKLAPWVYGFALLLQLSTFVIGKSVNGQQNWIVLGPVQFQPLELLKLSLILMLPTVMKDGYRSLKSYFWPLLVFLPGLGLVITQDFGGAMVLTVMFVAMLLVYKVPIWHLLLVALALGVAFPKVVFPHLKPYQQARLTIFVNPYQDARGQGYQVIQSTIAIGSGGMMGKGYKQGTQSHNGFVPEADTDFAFATWAEEQGLVGAVIVLLLYAALIWGLAGMASGSPRLQDQILFAGILGQVGFQAIENIGAALSMLPLTGITLPLISAGLSSLVMTLTTLGLAYVVYRDRFEKMI